MHTYTSFNLTSIWLVGVLGMVTILLLPLTSPCLSDVFHFSPKYGLQHYQFLHSLRENWEDSPTIPIPFHDRRRLHHSII